MVTTLEGYYSQKYGCPVICSLCINEGIAIRQYTADARERDIVLKRYDVTPLAYILNSEYERHSLFQKDNYLKSFINMLTTGAVSEISTNKVKLTIFIGLNYQVTGYLKDMHIPPHMKNKLQKGQELRCLVIGTEKKDSDIALTLSLTSKRLIEKMFEAKGHNVHCVRRIAGGRSIIQSTKHIPGDTIKNISDDLSERISVEVIK